jgi:hypothetical protein
MNRLETLKHENRYDLVCTAHVITYSFLTENTSVHVTPAVNYANKYYMTRRIGSIPKRPKIVAMDAGKEGKWVSYLTENNTKEHPVFAGWTKDQVTHSWLKQNGTVIIGKDLSKMFENIVKRTYPRIRVRNMTWMSLEDVLKMIGTVNDPTSLMGKIPKMAYERIPSPTLEQQIREIQGLSDSIRNHMAHAKECYELALCNALQQLYYTPGASSLVQLAGVRKQHKKVHEDACHLASVTKPCAKVVTNRRRMDTYCEGLMSLKQKLASI